MKELLISKYIDDQMNLDEKIDFVKEVKKDDGFYSETLEMLNQEKLLTFDVEYPEPLKVRVPIEKKKPVLRYLYPAVAIAAMIVLVFAFALRTYKTNYIRRVAATTNEVTYRFVYYNPSAKSVQIAGSFTNWKKVSMKRIDSTGYWEAYVKLPKNGIYKYNFIINGKKVIHDPTNPVRIYNGFGGVDSVLRL